VRRAEWEWGGNAFEGRVEALSLVKSGREALSSWALREKEAGGEVLRAEGLWCSTEEGEIENSEERDSELVWAEECSEALRRKGGSFIDSEEGEGAVELMWKAEVCNMQSNISYAAI
jgi:hypothetical protein